MYIPDILRGGSSQETQKRMLSGRVAWESVSARRMNEVLFLESAVDPVFLSFLSVDNFPPFFVRFATQGGVHMSSHHIQTATERDRQLERA
jgi:hypothetical protein